MDGTGAILACCHRRAAARASGVGGGCGGGDARTVLIVCLVMKLLDGFQTPQVASVHVSDWSSSSSSGKAERIASDGGASESSLGPSAK